MPSDQISKMPDETEDLSQLAAEGKEELDFESLVDQFHEQHNPDNAHDENKPGHDGADQYVSEQCGCDECRQTRATIVEIDDSDAESESSKFAMDALPAAANTGGMKLATLAMAKAEKDDRKKRKTSQKIAKGARGKTPGGKEGKAKKARGKTPKGTNCKGMGEDRPTPRFRMWSKSREAIITGELASPVRIVQRATPLSWYIMQSGSTNKCCHVVACAERRSSSYKEIIQLTKQKIDDGTIKHKVGAVSYVSELVEEFAR